MTFKKSCASMMMRMKNKQNWTMLQYQIRITKIVTEFVLMKATSAFKMIVK